MEQARQPEQVVHIDGGDDRALRHIGEQRQLAALVVGQAAVGAADQHIGLNAYGAQFLDRMLGGLGFYLAHGLQIRHQGQVNEQGMIAPQLHAHLPDRLQEGLGFYVAHRAADLHQRQVRVAGPFLDAAFDLVGDVRDDLHGGPKVIAAPFLLDDILIDLAGGEVVAPGHGGPHKAFVMPQVQVGLRAILRDIDLAMLKRAHGAGVHIDVGIQFQQGDIHPPGFEDRPQGGGGNPLPQGGNHAAGDEDIARHGAAAGNFRGSEAPDSKESRRGSSQCRGSAIYGGAC